MEQGLDVDASRSGLDLNARSGLPVPHAVARALLAKGGDTKVLLREAAKRIVGAAWSERWAEEEGGTSENGKGNNVSDMYR